jgi:transposase
MDVVNERCAGLDVHKKSVMACVRTIEEGGKVRKVVREFDTMTSGLRNLGEWMTAQGVTRVAMESTGVYWKPVFNVLEGQFDLLLCNAYHIKQVPGRKTDVKDCEWIAQLLQHGLLRGSFIPMREQRELRDLTRHRTKLIDQKTSVVNRLHKILEDANVKLSSVATDVLGKSGRAMIEAILGGHEEPKELAWAPLPADPELGGVHRRGRPADPAVHRIRGS